MGGTSTRRPAQDKRILAQLEHGARPPARAARTAGWTIDGWTIGLFALLLLMCITAWLMHDRTITPDTFRQSESRSATTRLPARTAVVTTPTQQRGAPEAPQAAAIVNVEMARGLEVPETLAVDTETPTAATVAIANAASATRPAAAVQPQTARSPAGVASKAASTRAPAPSAAGSIRQPMPASTDTDVTLLAALVAHAGTPTAVVPERSRDIVDRQDGDNTGQLLARCKQLGLIEGMLCRSRICSGRWESDAACRAPNH
nr:hypothetical protein [Duganella sp. 1224]